MTDSTITAATVETATAITNATKFSVETDLIKSAFPILRSVAENKKNPRGMCNSLFGFTADNTLVFDIKKDSLTVKAADVREKISLTVKNIPIKNLGAPVTIAFQNSKFDTFQKVLKTLSGEYSNFAIDGIYFRVFGEIADKVKKEIAKFSFDGCYSIDTARQEFFQKFFPTDEGKKLFEIDAEILIEMLEKVEKLIPKDNSDRFASVIFIVDNGKLKIVAGDSNTFGVVENDLNAKNCKFILPSSCLAVLKTLALNRTSDDLIEVIKNGDAVQFVHCGFTTIILTVPTKGKSPLEGYQKAFPAEFNGKIKIPAQTFKEMTEKAFLIDGADYSIFYATDDCLNTESFSQNCGQMRICENAEMSGKIKFALSLKLLKKVIPVFKSGNVEIDVAEDRVIYSFGKVKYLMGIARNASELAGMSFENKILATNYQTQLKNIDTEAEIKIYAHKQKKHDKDFFLQKMQAVKKQFDDSMEKNGTDSTVTSAVISEWKAKTDEEIQTFETEYKNFVADFEENIANIRETAEKQKAVIRSKLQEIFSKAA